MTILSAAETDTGESFCRLCGGAATFSFTEKILEKHPVAYWRCGQCGSLQTDRPYWLSEAYKSIVPVRDTGMVARTLQMAQITSLLLRIAGVGAQAIGLDWGGGNGLFCRMMRDQGFNFLNYDKYAEPFYCVGFAADQAAVSPCDVVTSFEVFEHLPDPKSDLAEIVALNPRIWIFSTQLYHGQASDWDYLALNTGKHVFFYSERGLHELAEKHGFQFIAGRHLHMFMRRAENTYFRGDHAPRFARMILDGGKFAGLAAALHFFTRQRRAYLRWQADREALGPRGLSPLPHSSFDKNN